MGSRGCHVADSYAEPATPPILTGGDGPSLSGEPRFSRTDPEQVNRIVMTAQPLAK